MSLILSGTDGISDVDGSASTPALRGTDANTGIFFPAADTIAFSEGGVESMRIDSSGNVGIGTTSPGTRLQIGNPSDANQALRFDFTDSSTARINSTRVGAGNLQSLLLAGQDTTQFYTNGAERMRIDSSGNVGIGTSSPAAKLNVVGGNIRLDNNQGVEWGGGNNYIYGNETTDIVVVATNGSERMRIDSSGNVGIGTSSPSGFLGNKLVIATGGTANEGITIYSSSNNGSLWFADATTGNGRYAGGIDYAHSTNAMVFYLDSIGDARFLSGGTLLTGGKSSATANGGDVQVSKGITFPATQSAQSDANTLDDYEEGTWTPVLTRDGTAPSISYGVREGKYTKIGNMVTCWITINSITVSSAGTGNNIITGLPFAIGNSTYGGTGGFGYNDAFTNTVYGVVMTGGTTQVYFRGGARSSGNDNGGWSSGGYLGLTITYFVN